MVCWGSIVRVGLIWDALELVVEADSHGPSSKNRSRTIAYSSFNLSSPLKSVAVHTEKLHDE
jgi:hypothetical protein